MRDYLHTVFEHFTEREKRAFERYLNVDRKLDSRKDKALLDMIAGLDVPEFASKKERDAYHQNRRRIAIKLTEFLEIRASRNRTSAEQKARRELTLAKYLFEQNEVSLAWKHLRKAERCADEEEDTEALQGVYREMIERIAQAPEDIDQKALLKSKLQIDRLAQYEENLTLASAVIKNQLLRAKEQGRVYDLSVYLDSLLRRLDLTEAVSESPKYSAHILRITRDALLTARDLSQFEEIATKMHDEGDWRIDNASSGTAKAVVEMQYMIAHAAYRNKNYPRAEHYLKRMEEVMEGHERTLYKQWAPAFISLQGMVLALTGKIDDAVSGHEEFMAEQGDRLPLTRKLNMELNLAWFYICQGKNKQAHKLLYHNTDSMAVITKLMGREWVMRRGLVYGLNHYELGNEDISLKVLKSLRNDFQDLLSLTVYHKATVFIDLSIEFLKDYHKFTRSEFVDRIKDQTAQISVQGEENKSLGFFAWLISKVYGKGYYQTVLDLVKGPETE